MFTIVYPDNTDATTVVVTYDEKYATLSYGEDSLVLPILAAPGNTYIVVFLTTDNTLRFVPTDPPVIAATLNYQIDSVILTLFPVPAFTAEEQ